jgi:hypothetical protein
MEFRNNDGSIVSTACTAAEAILTERREEYTAFIIPEESDHDTRAWWEARRHAFDLRISQFVLDEAGSGDESAATARLESLTGIPLLDVTEAARELAEQILQAGALPAKAALDAGHIAVAAVHAVDFLLTWNCRHIANAELIRLVQRVCHLHGYDCPAICTPEELMGDEQ